MGPGQRARDWRHLRRLRAEQGVEGVPAAPPQRVVTPPHAHLQPRDSIAIETERGHRDIVSCSARSQPWPARVRRLLLARRSRGICGADSASRQARRLTKEYAMALDRTRQLIIPVFAVIALSASALAWAGGFLG